MATLKVDERSLKQLRDTIVTQIINPKIDEINGGVREDIRFMAEEFRGSNVPSIADKGGTVSIVDYKKSKTRIQPIAGTEHTFKVNLYGEPDAPKWVNIDTTPGLRAWVDKKRPDYTHNRIRIRGKDDAGFPVPLGNKRRNFFGRAFDHLIGRDRTKYGLK